MNIYYCGAPLQLALIYIFEIELAYASTPRTGHRTLKSTALNVLFAFSVSSVPWALYVDRRTQHLVLASKNYYSYPLEQMMIRLCNEEVKWHGSTSDFARPEQLRLKQQLCACKLKCEFAIELPVTNVACMLQALHDKGVPAA
eukprot:6177603-Pleurochrysis_carterae.AAC.1